MSESIPVVVGSSGGRRSTLLPSASLRPMDRSRCYSINGSLLWTTTITTVSSAKVRSSHSPGPCPGGRITLFASIVVPSCYAITGNNRIKLLVQYEFFQSTLDLLSIAQPDATDATTSQTKSWVVFAAAATRSRALSSQQEQQQKQQKSIQQEVWCCVWLTSLFFAVNSISSCILSTDLVILTTYTKSTTVMWEYVRANK